MKILKIIPYIGLLIGLSKSSSAQSLLWKINNKKNNTVSYLYGTIHVQAQSVFLFDDKVEQAMDACDALAVEAFIDQITPEELKAVLYMKENKISEMLPEQDFHILDSLCQKHLGASAYMLDRLKPIMLASQLSIASLPKEMPEALDLYLLKKARGKGQKTYALETVKDQMKAFNKMTEKEQAKMLSETVRKPQEDDSLVKKLLKYYLKGDLKRLNQLMEADNTMPKKFQKTLLQKRNKKMLRKIQHLIKKESVFIAVGAAHLAGKKGLITLLRQRGYEVTSIPCSFRKK